MSSKKTSHIAGDIIFFSSLLFLVAMCIGCVRSIWFVFNQLYWTRLGTFTLSFFVGTLFALIIIRGYLSVFIHELKHAIVAIMAGNSPKGIKIGREEGHFEYEFTKDNKSYNAFIFLAPYYLPLFTTVLLLAGLYPFWEQQYALIALVGVGYGIDTTCGIRDIHPGQTDFSNLVGGFGIGIIYVLAMHILIFLSLLSWTLGGLDSLQNLYLDAFNFIFSMNIGKNPY